MAGGALVKQPGAASPLAVSTWDVTRKSKIGLRLIIVLIGTVSASFAYSPGTPEQAVVEILTATKPEEVEKHLPAAVVQEIESLDPADRRECEQRLLFGESLRRQGIVLSAPEDGNTLIVFQHEETKKVISLRREIIGGDQALLELLLKDSSSIDGSAIVWLNMVPSLAIWGPRP